MKKMILILLLLPTLALSHEVPKERSPVAEQVKRAWTEMEVNRAFAKARAMNKSKCNCNCEGKR